MKNQLIAIKKTMTFILLIFFCISCEKDNVSFNIDNPDVDKFVLQLKDGTYDQYKVGEDGEKLWTIMPKFKKEHIPLLINLAKDTSHISPCNHFPVNPISSIPPYHEFGEKPYIILGEYLLWCVERIINEKEFVSLTPLIYKGDDYNELLDGMEILELRQLYQDWWKTHGKTESISKFPLEGTGFRWR